MKFIVNLWGRCLHLLYLLLLATVIGYVWFQDGVKTLGANTT